MQTGLGQPCLLMGTLHPRAVMATLFVRAVVVGFAPVAAGCALADIEFLQVHFLRLAGDYRSLGARGQQILQFLQEMRLLINYPGTL